MAPHREARRPPPTFSRCPAHRAWHAGWRRHRNPAAAGNPRPCAVGQSHRPVHRRNAAGPAPARAPSSRRRRPRPVPRTPQRPSPRPARASPARPGSAAARNRTWPARAPGWPRSGRRPASLRRPSARPPPRPRPARCRARPACRPVPCANARAAPAGPAHAGPGWAPAGAGGCVRCRPAYPGAPDHHCIRPKAPVRSGLGVFFFRILLDDGGCELLAQRGLDLGGNRRVVLEVLAGVLLALTDALAVAAVPGTGLLDQLGVHAHVDQFALAADALAIEDLGDDLLERWRHLVLDHLDLGLVAD